MKFGGRTVTAILEFHGNKILLVKRGTVVFKGYWALPGGRVDAGETPEQAIVREVKEETGLNVEIVRKIGEYHEAGVQDGIEYDYYPACFLTKPIGGGLKRQEKEIEEIKLFNLERIPKELAFEHFNMIKDYVNNSIGRNTTTYPMNTQKLPLGQHEILQLPRWGIEHPVAPQNPKIDLKKWTLIIDGEVKNPLKLTWQDFLNLPASESESDFHCVEGWSVKNCKWYGVKFSTLVQIAKPNENTKHVFFKCLDGYTTSLSLEDLLLDGILLAYELNNKPLEEPLGGPLRLVVPQKYAYKSAMWVERITFSSKRELGYWEKRGYSDTADIWKNDRFTRRRNIAAEKRLNINGWLHLCTTLLSETLKS